MVKSQMTAITPATHADRHRHGAADPLTGDVRIDLFKTMNELSGSRTLGTTYQNTGDMPMLVIVEATMTATGHFGGYVKSSTPADTRVSSVYQSSVNGTVFAVMLVPPSYYYTADKHTTGTATLTTWYEWT